MIRVARIVIWLALGVSLGCSESHPPVTTACTSDRDCSAMALVCDREIEVCVECVAPTDCGAEEICLAGSCEPRIECTTSRMCPGLVCDPMRGYCVECVAVGDCADEETCRDGSCIVAECVAARDCEIGFRCDAGRCVTASPECSSSADCDAGERCHDGVCEPSPPECTADVDCEASERCVLGECLVDACTDDASCDDGMFCNGAERCRPGVTGVGSDGCASGPPPCAVDACDEDLEVCEVCDADFDGAMALGCGGADCNDDDVLVRPGAAELCDGIDTNCSTGGGAAPDEDGDADGYASTASGCVGGPIPSGDCDDTMASVHPGATEQCNGEDDDCDAIPDEPPAGADCAPGETCFAGACTTTPAGGIIQIAAGANHVCALHSSGRVYCWGGQAGYGQLGDGTDGPRLTAGAAVSSLTDAVAIAAGGNHTCALRSGGGLVCWGYASFGQIGDGEEPFSRSTPRAVVGLGSAVTDFTGAAISTCAVLETGDVQCWGDGRNGVIGDGTRARRLTPAYVLGLSGVERVHGGYEYACAVRTDRSVACWGENNNGQLGDGTLETRLSPVDTFAPTLRVDELSPGGLFVCARIGGAVSCWGRMPGTTSPTFAVTSVPGITDAVEVASSYESACARRASGSVVCWGRNDRGQLGIGTMDAGNTSPTTPVSGLTDATQLAIPNTSNFACALRSTGQVACWGTNESGQLGNGTTTASATPVTVMGLP